MSRESAQSRAAGLEAEAADWLARLDRDGRLDGDVELEAVAAQDPDFGAWLNQSAAHRVAALRLWSTWRRTERLAALRRPVAPARAAQAPARRTVLVAASAAAAGVALVAGVLGASHFGAFFSGAPRGAVDTAAYETPVGGKLDVMLPDGSAVTLNSATQLSFRREAAAHRVMLLEGEAYFSVSRERDAPFIVDAGRGEVRVLGTEFAVERRGDMIEVAVTEGEVLLSGSDPLSAEALRAGMIGFVSADGVLVEEVGAESVDDRLLWREGRVRFSRTRLSEAAAEFNRYNDTQLIIGDAETGAIQIGGTFRVDDPEAFARLAQSGLGLTVRRREGVIELRAD